MLTLAQLAPLKDRDPYLYETLTRIVSAVNATSQRAGVDPSVPAPAPSPVASINVQAANGWIDIDIADPSRARRPHKLQSPYRLLRHGLRLSPLRAPRLILFRGVRCHARL